MTILGLEHEYEVRRRGAPIDFRTRIEDVAREGVQLDPVDPYARRMPDGSVLTCDGAEAETAAPPIDIRPGFADEICAWADAMAQRLNGHELQGVSTHLSIEVPDAMTLPVCGHFARRFAPALMLLGDGPEGQGLLVRPRHRRVELGLGFTAGAWLRASAALAAGGALACVDVATGTASTRSLPPRVVARVEGARARFGWYIDRTAHGPDLYSAGRRARLRLGLVRRASASKVLQVAWATARRRLLRDGLADVRDLEDGDDLVAGRAALHCESSQARRPATPVTQPTPSALGRAATCRRAGFDVVAVAATWDFTLYAVRGSRDLYLSIPRTAAARFHADLENGRLDAMLWRELCARSSGRTLATYAEAERGGRFDAVVLPALRPPERAYDGSLL